MSWPDILLSYGTALKGMGWAFLPVTVLPLILVLFPKIPALSALGMAIIRTIDSLNYGLGEIIKWALPLLVLSVAMSVFALSIFGLSWTKLSESAEYLHAAAIMLGAGATLLAGQHVRVDIFYGHMNSRSKALVDFCGYFLLLLPVCLTLIWNSQSFVNFSWLIFEGSAEADGIRGEFLLKTLIPLFALLLIVQGLAIALRAAMTLTDIPQPPRPKHTPEFFTPEETHP